MNIDWDKEFEQIFRDNYQKLISYACRIVEPEEAEDIVDDVFFEIWNRRSGLNIDHKGLKPYLLRSVYNRALNALRHRNVSETSISLLNRLNDLRLEYLATDITPDTIVQRSEIRHAIDEAIASLPEKCRQVFTLSYLHNLKNQDIADIMNVSPRTVDAHIYRALRVLREKLKFLLPFCFFLLSRLSDFNINFVN